MQNTVISVMGGKGSGKSTLVKEIVDEAPRVIVFDTMGEYNSRRDKPIESHEGALSELGRIQHESRFRVVLRLVDDEQALSAMRVAYDVGKPGKPTLIVVEETSFYCSPNHLPPELARFVRYGRHQSLDQIYVSRRPAEIHRDLTAQSDIIVSFRQHEPNDIAYLIRAMGPEAKNLPHLADYQIMVSGDIEKAPLPILERLAGKSGAGKKKTKAPKRGVGSTYLNEEENSVDTEDEPE